MGNHSLNHVPIILLPYLGLLKTAFAVGILNLAVAGLILYMFRAEVGVTEWQGVAKSLRFDTDSDAVAVDVLMLDTQAIVHYYERRWQQWR